MVSVGACGTIAFLGFWRSSKSGIMTTEIRFDDGAAYERYMGKWSQLAGEAFLDWLAPAPGLRWLDVGCGNGAFTEMLAERCAPASVKGIDPSERSWPMLASSARGSGPARRRLRTIAGERAGNSAVLPALDMAPALELSFQEHFPKPDPLSAG